VVGHLVLHDLICGAKVAGEDKALTESSIETEMGFMREPNKVTSTAVGIVAVQMVTLVLTSEPVHTTRTDPSDSHKDMTMGITNPTAHAWVIRMNVRFATEILRHVGLVRIQTSGRKRVEQPGL
jgi:hypothetical protein